MNNWRNRIFNNLQNIINDDTVEYRVTNNNKLVNDRTIYFVMLGNIETENDLENTEENAQLIRIQIETFTKSMSDGYVLMEKVVSAMKQMSFNKDYGIEMMSNITDTNYIRLVARFSRYIGSGEEIEKIN